MENTQLIVAVCLISLVLISFMSLYSSEEDKCDSQVIKNHIVSLTHHYTDSEKEAMIPKIKLYLGCK